MKKLFGLLIIFSLLFSVSGALAGPDGPPNPIYLPVLMRGGGGAGQTFTVSGAVKDVDGVPVSDVLVKDLYGAADTTDTNGYYAVEVQPGSNTLTATRSGYDIAPKHINVVQDQNVVNFEAQVGCGNIVVNESINVGMGGWDFLTDKDKWPDFVIPGTDISVYYSAPSSGRVGINPGVDDNVPSTTRARSQAYHIPSDADAVILGLWIYQVVEGGREFDRQYIDILDEHNNIISEFDFYYSGVSTDGWVYVERPMDRHIGHTIKIQLRTVNDGENSYMTTWFDDVNLVICNTHCDNQITNGGFEIWDPNPAISGWVAIGPQNVWPVYTGTQFHRGFYSMQTGIPDTENPFDPTSNFFKEAFTEAYQDVDLRDPSGYHYTEALLTFWLYTTRLYGIVPPPPAPSSEIGQIREVPAIKVPAVEGLSDSPFALTGPPEEDWIYVYIYDNNWNLLDRLIWEKATDTRTWIRYEFDVSEYLGRRIKLLFGTYNDGRGGPSAMYIDDVVLGRCE